MTENQDNPEYRLKGVYCSDPNCMAKIPFNEGQFECHVCAQILCEACIERCTKCDLWVCGDCRHKCDTCRQTVCEDCSVVDEGWRCSQKCIDLWRQKNETD